MSDVPCASSATLPTWNLSVDEVAMPRDIFSPVTFDVLAAFKNDEKMPATGWNPTPVSLKFPALVWVLNEPILY